MAAARPYASARDAIHQSGVIVAELAVPDLAEALAGHPRIGERPDTGPEIDQDGATAAGWSRQEQAGSGISTWCALLDEPGPSC
jgi:hypothetical protein